MKKQIILSAIVIVLVSFGFSVLAQTKVVAPPPPSEDEVNAQALKQAQDLLRDSQQRSGALDTQEARDAAKNVRVAAVGNKNHENDMFNISADLLPWVLKEYGNQDLSKLATDPKALSDFIAKMPSTEREKIKSLAGRIEDERRSKTNSP